jgi:hypothetical protein
MGSVHDFDFVIVIEGSSITAEGDRDHLVGTCRDIGHLERELEPAPIGVREAFISEIPHGTSGMLVGRRATSNEI